MGGVDPGIRYTHVDTIGAMDLVATSGVNWVEVVGISVSMNMSVSMRMSVSMHGTSGSGIDIVCIRDWSVEIRYVLVVIATAC